MVMLVQVPQVCFPFRELYFTKEKFIVIVPVNVPVPTPKCLSGGDRVLGKSDW